MRRFRGLVAGLVGPAPCEGLATSVVRLRDAPRLPITAAGGITTDAEIAALEALGMNVALGILIYRRVFPELFD